MNELNQAVSMVASGTPVGAVAQAVANVAACVRPLIETAVAEKYEREHLNAINQIQHAFVFNSADELWALAHRLCGANGHPPAPSGSNGVNVPLGVLHALLLCCADAQRDRSYMVKYIEAMSQK